jgi:hypothetical protein
MGDRGEVEPSAWILHALVVSAPHADPGSTHDAREQGSLEDVDEMENLFSGARCDVFDRVRYLEHDVLVELPPKAMFTS